MWDKLRKQIAVERKQLNRLFEIYHPLIARVEDRPPDFVELPALATVLHSFYTGIENLFKRITLACGDPMPGGPSSHQTLLDAMVEAGPQRPAVISPSMRDTLDAYRDFRHMFRHAYGFILDWSRMAPLVRDAEDTWSRLDVELQAFLDKLGKQT